jgi:hypothetical protein
LAKPISGKHLPSSTGCCGSNSFSEEAIGSEDSHGVHTIIFSGNSSKHDWLFGAQQKVL